MKERLRITLAVAFIFALSCKETPSVSTQLSEEQLINNWIREQMDIYYFWEDLVPKTAPENMEAEAFFKSMLDASDIFSFITNDSESLTSELNGVSYEAGYSPTFGRFNGSNDVFIIVEFVYPDTPAEAAGIERGDLILGINGETLTISNYLTLYYSEGPSTLSMGSYVFNEETQKGSISQSDEVITVEKAVLELDPVVYTNTYEYGADKIGYLFYSGFLNGESDQFIESVNNAFINFKNEGITDLVIDLRYNPGGRVTAAVNMANAIVPQTNAKNNDVFVSYVYNSFIQNYYTEREGPNSENLFLRFNNSDFTFGLDRVYFLTSNSSASASELIINGLDPYMDVYSIGENTFGKYYGSFVILGESATPPNNYAIVPVVFKYANALGVTDFVDGLAPDFSAEENIFQPYPIGDVNDPLFSVAIEHITKGAVITKPVNRKIPSFERLPDPIRQRNAEVLFIKNE